MASSDISEVDSRIHRSTRCGSAPAAWLWFLSAMMLCVAMAASPAVADPLTLTWRTHVQSPDLLTSEFNRLYYSLNQFYDQEVSVATQRVALDGRTPGQALADAHQTPAVVNDGQSLAYACRLNPKVCSVTNNAAH